MAFNDEVLDKLKEVKLLYVQEIRSMIKETVDDVNDLLLGATEIPKDVDMLTEITSTLIKLITGNINFTKKRECLLDIESCKDRICYLLFKFSEFMKEAVAEDTRNVFHYVILFKKILSLYRSLEYMAEIVGSAEEIEI